jgi:hypothetical protein
MTYEEFLKFVPTKCMYETIYDDSEGRPILVIRMLDAYGMVNKAQRPWVGLTDEDKNDCLVSADPCECLANPEAHQLMDDVETKLKEKNT